MSDGLSPRQERFCLEYVKDLNGQNAAIRAKYSENGASVQATRLLANARVAARIAELQEAVIEDAGVTATQVLRELGRIALADPRQVAQWGTREIAVGFDADGKRLDLQDLDEAVVVHRENRPYVEAYDSDSISDEAASSISAIGMNKYGHTVKFHSKESALRTLAQHFALLLPDPSAGTNVTFNIFGGPPLAPED